MLQDLPVWLAHFRSQAAHPRQVPAALDDTLTGRERRLIQDSIALFQRGERATGMQLCRAVRHAPLPDSDALEEIFELLTAEARRHAALLGEFMQDHEIPPRTGTTERIFRGPRYLGGLATRLRMLLVAQIIGVVYYRALEGVTDCRRLQILCRTLAADELAHVAFESRLLLAIRGAPTGAHRRLAAACDQCILTATSLLVWITHRRVLKSAGYGPLLFLRDCHSQYAFNLQWPPVPDRSHLRRRQPRPLSPHGTSVHP